MKNSNEIHANSPDDENLSDESEFEEVAENEESDGTAGEEDNSDEESEIDDDTADVQALLHKSPGKPDKPGKPALEAKTKATQNKEKNIGNAKEKSKPMTETTGGVKKTVLPGTASITSKRLSLRTYQEMVDSAILDLNEREGSSVPAIKKYIVGKYQVVNENRVGLNVMRYVRKALQAGKMVQIKRSYKFSDDTKKTLLQAKMKEIKTLNNPTDNKVNVKKQAMQSNEAKHKSATKPKPLKETTANALPALTAAPREKKSKATKVSTQSSKKTVTAVAKTADAKENKENMPAKSVKLKGAKAATTKKKSTQQRKSIGSLIKPPPGPKSKTLKSTATAEKGRGRPAKTATPSSGITAVTTKTAEKVKGAKKK